MTDAVATRTADDSHTTALDVPLATAGTAVLLWSIVLAWLAVVRHNGLHTGYDLAVFTQIVWATAHGVPYFTSLTLETTNFLGFHFSPILAVLAPLYRLWPDARLLLVAQALVLALPALPLFTFTRTRTGDRLALLVVAAYLLSPLLHWIALQDYHVITFAVPLLMLAGIAVIEQRYRAMLVWLILALLVKEEIALIAVGFGLYVLLVQREWRVGAALTVATVAWAIVQFGVLMPAWTETGGSYVFVRRYGSLGESPAHVLRTLVTSPATVAGVVATRAKAFFTWQLLAPLVGLPLLGLPATLLALPTFAYLILSDYALQTSIQHHYTAPLIPFLFLGTVVGMQRLSARSERVGQYAAVAIAVAALISAWWWGPLPGARQQQPEWFTVSEEARAVRAVIARVPDEAPVAADWAYLPWLANRRRLDMVIRPPYRLLGPDRAPAYVLTQRQDDNAFSAPIYPWLIHDEPATALRVHQFARQDTPAETLAVWEYRGQEHDVLLDRLDMPFERGLRLAGANLPADRTLEVAPGDTLPFWLAWRAEQPLEQRLTFTLHLVSDAGDHVSQVDKEMAGGRFPTTLWHTWMETPTVADAFPLPIPENLPADRYGVLAGVYEQETLTPIRSIDGAQWIEIATIDVQ